MNEETTANNYYQKELNLSQEQIQQNVQKEFDEFVEVLRENGVNVIVVNDTADPSTPDSIFPNNWISFHADGKVAIYPMFAVNRRKERRADIVDSLREDFAVNQIADFSMFENEGIFLEGTGSMILDRENSVAYAALSERTNADLLEKFCDQLWYEPLTFTANQSVDGARLPIYHTNVMMSITSRLAIVCFDSIDSVIEKELLLAKLSSAGKIIIDITEDQVNNFVGNVLEVKGNADKTLLVMSTQAYDNLNPGQQRVMDVFHKIVHSPLDTIEALGGGSARCMMAEVFLPRT